MKTQTNKKIGIIDLQEKGFLKTVKEKLYLFKWAPQ